MIDYPFYYTGVYSYQNDKHELVKVSIQIGAYSRGHAVYHWDRFCDEQKLTEFKALSLKLESRGE